MENLVYTTEEVSEMLKVKPGTIRRGLCVNGHWCGIVPIKLSNRMLRWPADAVDRLLDPRNSKAE